MRFLSADWIFPLHIPPIKNGVIQVSETGKIINIFHNRDQVNITLLEIYDGILCPGFVNAHCHLELSHLFGLADKKKGLINFIEVIRSRNSFTKKQIYESIEFDEQNMINNGIVAVGDICNTTDTIFQKQKNKIKYYNFIEVFQLDEKKINETIHNARLIRNSFRNSTLLATIVPHSYYSVSFNLMSKVIEEFNETDRLLCIHNQETKSENDFFDHRNGKLFNWILSLNPLSKTYNDRKKSTRIMNQLDNKRLMMVHNTFSCKKEIKDYFYCTCPKANIYIENSLPNYSIFNPEKLCVGTDSLASNDSLCIFEELLVIKKHSEFNKQDLLNIGCKNGAIALGFDSLGTFEKGKTPGVNLINSRFTKFKKVII